MAPRDPEQVVVLDLAAASALAQLPLRCIETEFPNKLDHVMNAMDDVRTPRALHPVFYGCFDWHSAVHGHWMLVRLLRLFPDMPPARDVRAVLNRHFTTENVRAEVAYLNEPNRRSFERTYGWAWLLKLCQELQESKDSECRHWFDHLEPLAKAIVTRYCEFLPKQNYAVRTGVHPNTAFGLALAIDYARAARLHAFEELLAERARFYFLADEDCPAEWEPGGEDFLSPALAEADLMRRVLAVGKFQEWFRRFLPNLEGGYPRLLNPVTVTDRSDPKLVHLDGLNLSRAWCMRGISRVLSEKDPTREILLHSAQKHLEATLPQIASGHYEGEHWLASFALLAISNI